MLRRKAGGTGRLSLGPLDGHWTPEAHAAVGWGLAGFPAERELARLRSTAR